MIFDKDIANDVYVVATDGTGAAITGLTSVDFTVYVSKVGAAGAGVVPTGVLEVESTGMAGIYSVALASGVFDTAGQIALSVQMTGAVDYRVLGEVTAINSSTLDTRTLSTDDNVNGMVTTLDNVDITVSDTNGVVTTTSTNVDAILVDTTNIEEIALDIRATAGQIGFRITNAIYNGDNQLESATLEGYEPGDTPGVDVPRLTLSLESTYDGSGRMTEYKVSE